MHHSIRRMALASLTLLCVSQAIAQGTGVTSGPAVGSPATMGTGGQSAATPDQSNVLRNQGGAAIRNEQAGQSGGTSASVKPGLPDAGAGVHPATKP